MLKYLHHRILSRIYGYVWNPDLPMDHIQSYSFEVVNDTLEFSSQQSLDQRVYEGWNS